MLSVLNRWESMTILQRGHLKGSVVSLVLWLLAIFVPPLNLGRPAVPPPGVSYSEGEVAIGVSVVSLLAYMLASFLLYQSRSDMAIVNHSYRVCKKSTMWKSIAAGFIATTCLQILVLDPFHPSLAKWMIWLALLITTSYLTVGWAKIASEDAESENGVAVFMGIASVILTLLSWIALIFLLVM